MTVDIATLAVNVDTSSVKAGTGALNDFEKRAQAVERANNSLGSSFRKTSDDAKLTAKITKDTETAFDRYKQKITELDTAHRRGLVSTDLARKAVAIYTAELKRSQGAFDGFGGKISAFNGRMASLSSSMQNTLSALFGGAMVMGFLRTADSINVMEAQLNSVTHAGESYSDTYNRVLQIANENQSSFQSTADLYVKTSRAMEEYGATSNQVATFTDNLSKTFRAAGMSAEDQSASILQLSQSMSSGRMQGDEFRSLSERAPLFMKVLADSIGVPIGRLKQLGSDGKLTSDLIFNSFQKVPDAIKGIIPPSTVSGAYTVLKNKFDDWIHSQDKAVGVSKAVADSILWIGNNIETVIPIVGVGLVGALGASTLSMAAFTLATLANPIVWFTAAVALLAAGFFDLGGKVNGVAKDNSLKSWASDAMMLLAKVADVAVYVSKAVMAVGSSFRAVYNDMVVSVKWMNHVLPAFGQTQEQADAQYQDAKAQRESDLATANNNYSELGKYDWNIEKKAQAYLSQSGTKSIGDIATGVLNGAMAKNTAALGANTAIHLKSHDSLNKTLDSLKLKGKSAIGGGSAASGTILAAKGIQDILGGNLKYFAAINDKSHQGRDSKHNQGLAFDFSLTKPERSSDVKFMVEKYMAEIGFTGKDYKVLDEYKNPSKNATGGHMHFQFQNQAAASKFAGGYDQTSKWANNSDLYANTQTESDRYRESVKEQIAMLGKQTELERLLANIQLGKYGKLSDAEIKSLSHDAAALDYAKKKIELNDLQKDNADKLKSMADEISLIGKSADEIERLSFVRDLERQAAKLRADATPEIITSINSEVQAQIAARDALMKKRIEIEQQNRGDWTFGAKAALSDWGKNASDVAGQTKQAFSNAFDGMTGALTDLVTTGKADFKGLAASILKDIAAMMVKMAAFNALKSLGSAMGGSSTGWVKSIGTAISGAFGVTPQANGGAWSNGVQMFANGGAFTNSIVSSPTAFGMSGGGLGVMGEAGAEAIMPLTRTSGGKLGVMAVGGGGGIGSVNVTVVNHIQSDGSSKTSATSDGGAGGYKKLGEMMAAKAREVIQQEMRQGGVLAMTR